MSEQPTGYDRFTAIGGQLPAIETFRYLAQTFPALPPAYLTAHAFEAMGVQLLVDTGSDVEAWRTALQVPADTVVMRRYSDYTTIEIATVVRGVAVKVFGSTPLLPDRAKLSPAEDAEQRRAAALIEQRHQAEDPAVPPPAFAEPAPAKQVEVRTLADAQGGAL